ncbi:MAG: hypothetical protein V1922_05165 [bacterium]
MKTIFIIISSSLALISPLVYAKAILKGEARPHRTTRLILLIITSLATISLFVQHDTVAIWLAGVLTVQSILIFFLSIKYGMGGWSRTDVLCFVIALFGIMLWQTTKDPSLALYASILADFTGMIPALIKTFHFPETEVWTFYALDVCAAIFSLFAVRSFTIQQFSYPLYIILVNLLMVLFVLRRKGEKNTTT